VGALEIEDIFLVSEIASVSRELNPSDRRATAIPTLQRVRVEEQVFGQLRVPVNDAESKGFLIARFFVVCELFIAKQGVKPVEGEFKEEDQVAKIEHTFAADYRVANNEMPDGDALGAFIPNVVYHVWPYWREAVHEQTARMRLPTITIPMMKSTVGSDNKRHLVAGGITMDKLMAESSTQ
jgi:hypothetical protein